MLKFSTERALELMRQPPIRVFQGNEKDFESVVAGNLPEIFECMGLPKIEDLRRQFWMETSDSRARLDIAVSHEDGSISVIEVKRVNPKFRANSSYSQVTAVGQLLLYRSLIKAKFNRIPRLFLFDTKIHLRTVMVFNEMRLPITLVEVQDDRIFIPYGLNYLE